MGKTHIITSSGFECDIDEGALDDMELLDDLVAIDGGDVSKFTPADKKILGDDEKERLYEHIRDDSGRVPVSAFGVELGDIIKGLNSKKK